jgi:hypothetical protein
LFLVIYFLLGDKGRKLLPGLHHDPQPTSYVLPPASDIIQLKACDRIMAVGLAPA